MHANLRQMKGAYNNLSATAQLSHCHMPSMVRVLSVRTMFPTDEADGCLDCLEYYETTLYVMGRCCCCCC